MSLAINEHVEEIVIPAPEFRGGNFALGACQDLEVCLDGPAGTGKTVAALYKVHMMLTMYPGAKALVARKTNTALAGSAIATYREMIQPEEGIVYFGGNKIKPAAFIYPNGSEMIVNGLEGHRRDKIKSWEFSIAYINEATECDEEDIEYVRSRLRQGKTPYHQLIMDCNPDAPEHWLNQRMESGKTTRLLSQHEDNPRYFDIQMNDWTPEGQEYIFETLGGLSGVLLERMRFGVWAAAHGTIYQDAWNRARNVIDPFPIPRDWSRWLGIDFGFTNPFVCKWYAQDPDGRLIVYREIYMTKKLVEEHCKDIAIASGWFNRLPKDHERYREMPDENADPIPRGIICDHDAEGRFTLEKHLGLLTTPAQKSVLEGIQLVAARLKPARDGIPRLRYFNNCLVQVDRDLERRKMPTCSVQEFNVYVWKKGTDQNEKDEPAKEYDHGCFVAGTLVRTDYGDVPIEQVQVGDRVLTRDGYKEVKAAGMTDPSAEVFTVRFSSGATLTGTANHPIYLKGKGYTPLHALRYGDIIMDINSGKERYPLLCQNVQQTEWKLLSTRVLHLGAIQSQRTGQTRVTTDQVPHMLQRVLRPFIKKSGKMLTGLFQKDARSITKTAILPIMPWIILNVLRQKSMHNIMLRTSQKSDWKSYAKEPIMLGLLQANGISRKRAGHGIANLDRYLGRMPNIAHSFVRIAGRNFSQETIGMTDLAIAPIAANLLRVEGQVPMISHPYVNTAITSLSTASTTKNAFAHENAPENGTTPRRFTKQEPVQSAMSHSRQGTLASKSTAQEHAQAVVVCSISKSEKLQPVYNITVDNTVGEGEYFANGILVHNCDVDRYVVCHFDLKPSGVRYSSRVYSGVRK